jgi:hypothetical protein
MLFINYPIKDDMIIVPEDQDIASYGLEEGQVKRPLNLGGGYPANLEVFHQLHCLVSTSYYFSAHKVSLTLTPQNLIRQTSHYNFDYYIERRTHAFSNGDTEDLYRHSSKKISGEFKHLIYL